MNSQTIAVNLKKERSENRSIFRPWLEEHGSKLLYFARNQTRSLADAEDVLQESLVKLARKVEEGTFIGDQNDWLNFIYTQIRREAVDLIRKTERRRAREETVVGDLRSLDELHELPQVGVGEEEDEVRQVLRRNLAALPKKFSEVIQMKIWGGRTFAEISEILGIPLNTAASRYRYGIEALRKSLSGSSF